MMKALARRLLSTLIICGALFSLCTLGIALRQQPLAFPFCYAAVYLLSFVLWRAYGSPTPFYFFICLGFLLSYVGAGGYWTNENMLLFWPAATGVMLVGQLAVALVRRPEDPCPELGVVRGVLERYRIAFKDHGRALYRAAVHALVLFVASWSVFLLPAANSFWALISASAVVIGEDNGKTIMRGMRRCAGAAVGAAVACVLVLAGVGPVGLGITFAVAFIAHSLLLMPKRYILGSACIGLEAVCAYAILDGGLTFALAAERAVWTVAGALLVMGLCMLINLSKDSPYDDCALERLVVPFEWKRVKSSTKAE